jgi:hypothetical protein
MVGEGFWHVRGVGRDKDKSKCPLSQVPVADVVHAYTTTTMQEGTAAAVHPTPINIAPGIQLPATVRCTMTLQRNTPLSNYLPRSTPCLLSWPATLRTRTSTRTRNLTTPIMMFLSLSLPRSNI